MVVETRSATTNVFAAAAESVSKVFAGAADMATKVFADAADNVAGTTRRQGKENENPTARKAQPSMRKEPTARKAGLSARPTAGSLPKVDEEAPSQSEANAAKAAGYAPKWDPDSGPAAGGAPPPKAADAAPGARPAAAGPNPAAGARPPPKPAPKPAPKPNNAFGEAQRKREAEMKKKKDAEAELRARWAKKKEEEEAKKAREKAEQKKRAADDAARRAANQQQRKPGGAPPPGGGGARRPTPPPGRGPQARPAPKRAQPARKAKAQTAQQRADAAIDQVRAGLRKGSSEAALKALDRARQLAQNDPNLPLTDTQLDELKREIESMPWAATQVLRFSAYSPFSALGIERLAAARTLNTVNKRNLLKNYRKLALQLHPDKCDHPVANDAMQALNCAYDKVTAKPKEKPRAPSRPGARPRPGARR